MTKYTIFWKSLFFWLLFILLNNLLNIPSWISQLVQSDYLTTLTTTNLLKSLWYAPKSTTLFHLNGDLILLLIPLFILARVNILKAIYCAIASLAFLLLLYYNIYYEGYQGLYSVHPIFANDWIIVKEILPTFLNELSIDKRNYLVGVIGFLFVSALLVFCFYHLALWFVKLKQKTSFWIPSILIIVIWGLGLQSYNKNKITNEENNFTKNNFTTFTNWTFPRIQVSSKLGKTDPLAHLKKRWIYDLYRNKALVKKPNVYLLFIESYGAVATLSAECSDKFQDLANNLEGQLEADDWHITSNYSKSPVIGGRSWLALTTTMTGANIDDQIQYNGLIKEHRQFPHMIDFFNNQGYETVRVSTMSSKDIDTMSMITIPNLYWKFNQRLLFSDIPYKGFRYDYYGGISDQYTLGYVQENNLDTLSVPHFMTFITMNSHGPWSNGPPIVADWKSLDTLLNPYPNGRPPLSMHINQYWDLVEYELKMLTDFILKEGDEESIFILLGDHNPAGLEWKIYGRYNKWATPIHIISKDASFVNSFQQHGFTEGMVVDTAQHKVMRHMGLYSLLTRQLLEQYGKEEEVLPEYLPWGLRLE